MFSFKSLAVLAAFVLTVTAQSSTDTASAPDASSTPAPDACIITCSTSAASSAGCSSFADLSCVCTSAAFQSAALACLQANCTADDVAAATALQQEECAGVSGASSVASATGSGGTSIATTTSVAVTSATVSGGSTVSGASSASKAATSGAASPTGTTPASSSSSSSAASAMKFGSSSVVAAGVAAFGALVGGALAL